jgi:methylthioribose-1-phosphate isomerase
MYLGLCCLLRERMALLQATERQCRAVHKPMKQRYQGQGAMLKRQAPALATAAAMGLVLASQRQMEVYHKT